MLLPESVLAAIIAGTATLSASFLQLRSALLRDNASNRTPSAATRRKSRLQLIILLVIIGAAAVSGFALSQWLNEGERAAQGVMQRELQARVAELGRAANQLELTRGSERADIESGVWRRIGAEGVVVTATVPVCRPGCTEADATAVTLCATIPDNASVLEVALFSRAADSDAPWSSSRFLPGQEAAEARFAETYSESAPEAGMRQVCQAFTHWSAAHARTVRVVVRYSLPI
jgi:hypothetical protein